MDRQRIQLCFLWIGLLFFGIGATRAQQELPFMRNGVLAYCVYDPSTDEIIEAQNKDLLLPSASTMKALTSTVVLDILDSDYRYTTQIFTDGQIREDGRLDGHIIVSGNGDPTLGSRYFQKLSIDQLVDTWADRILESGAKEITGDVIVLDNYFHGPPQSPDWLYRDMGNYYAAGIWSINAQDNAFGLTFSRSPKPGERCDLQKVSIDVFSPDGIFHQVYTGPSGSGDQAYVYSTHNSNMVEVYGTLPPGRDPFTVYASIPNLPRVIGDKLYECLESKDIRVRGSVRVHRDSEVYEIRHVFWEKLSPRLIDIVRVTNENSVNHYAEALLRTLGENQSGKGAYSTSLDKGIQAVKNYWQERSVGIDHFVINDGSGLSPQNGVTADGMARAMGTYSNRDQLKDILAIAGVEGTMRSFCEPSSPLYGNLWAKSGYITGTQAYTGILRAKSGRELAFAINAYQYPETNYKLVKQYIRSWFQEVWQKN